MAKRLPEKTYQNYYIAKHKRPRKRKKRRIIPILICLIILIGVFFFVKYKTNTPQFSEEDYPPSLIALAKSQPEATSFVKGYPNRNVLENIGLSDDLDSEHVPLFLQWDKRWGYDEYGDDFLAITGCGPTCLSMVYVYLTGDLSMHPGKLAEWAWKEGFYVSGTGTSWSLMDLGAEALGLNVHTTSLGSNQIVSALQNGEVIICSVGPGDFTTEGHFIVLSEIDDEGKIIVRDPNSKERSNKKWDLEQILPQIKQFWIYTPAIYP